MAIETLLDELLSIACGSVDATELEARFNQLAKGQSAWHEELAAEVLHSIHLLRIQAKEMESLATLQTLQRDLEKMNLDGWVNQTRDRAVDLRRDADELERVAVAAGVIEAPVSAQSLQGIWEGAEITDEDIEEAKRSWDKAVDDFEP